MPLVVQPAPGDPGLFVGCIGLPATLLEELIDHPNEFYWNVHTAVFPAGAIRGQVFLEKK